MANERKSKKRPKYKQNTEKYSIDSIQKTALLGTSDIIWKVLQTETLSLSCGNSLSYHEGNSAVKKHVTKDLIPIIIISPKAGIDFRYVKKK